MKPFLLYLFCACNAYLLVMHMIGGRRRIVFGVMLVAVVWLGMGHLLYDIGTRAPWLPRHTIAWPMLLLLFSTAWVLTPGAWYRKALEVTDNGFDSTIPSAPAPLIDGADMRNPQ